MRGLKSCLSSPGATPVSVLGLGVAVFHRAGSVLEAKLACNWSTARQQLNSEHRPAPCSLRPLQTEAAIGGSPCGSVSIGQWKAERPAELSGKEKTPVQVADGNC